MPEKTLERSQGGFTKSLSFRLGFTIAFGILVTSSLATTGVIWRAIDRQIDDRSIEIRSMAQVLSASLSQAVADRDQARIYAGLRTIQYSPRITFAQILTDEGVQLAQVGHHVALTNADDGAEVGWASQLERMFGRDGIVEDVEIRNRGRTVGFLKLAGQVPAARDALFSEMKNAAWWAIIAILIGVAMAYRQQRRIIRPIGLLTDVMARVSPDTKLPSRVDVDGVGEVAVLVGSYNTMIEQVVQRDNLIAKHTEHLEETVDTRTRQLRVARDEAEQAADAKARFLATMSHEIRTPMNGVLVMAELLARSDLKAEQKGYARVIAKSGETLLDLLNDILDISKFDAADVALENVPLSLDELANDAITIFWEQAKEKGVELVASVDAQVPSIVSGDPKRLRQCLANLVGNALKFTETGSVSVDVSIDPQGRLALAVTDTGAGIAEERREAIFEAFEQEDRSTSRTHGGTGLGLAIVKGLVEAHGAELSISSRKGAGTRVSVTLGAVIAESEADSDCVLTSIDHADLVQTDRPVIGIWSFGKSEPREQLERGSLADLLAVPYTRADVTSLLTRVANDTYLGIEAIGSGQPTENQQVRDYSGVRVLIADDGAVNRQVLCDALGVYGIEPVVTENGEQAIESAKDTNFDLILLDGTMPLVDGYEAAERIRSDERLTGADRAKLMLFTSDFESSSGDGWRKFGFDGTLSKPFQMSELDRLLSACAGTDVQFMPRSVSARSASVGSNDSWISPTVIETLEVLESKRPGALRRVYGRFTETLPVSVEQLYDALREDDIDAIRRNAHALKSICGSAGAVRLAELAADIELRATGAIASDTTVEIDDDTRDNLETAIAATNQAVETLLSSHPDDLGKTAT